MRNKGNGLLSLIYILFVLVSCGLEANGMLKDAGINEIVPSTNTSVSELVNTSSPVIDNKSNNHIVLTSNNTKEDNTYFNIEFIDVGQGDAILVECNGHYMIVDGGNKDKSDLMYSLLTNKKVTYIDYILATHADADHIGGLSGVLNYCINNNVKVGKIICNDSADTEEYNDFVKYCGILSNSIESVDEGETLYLKDTKISVLSSGVDKDNDASIVLMLAYGQNNILLTGDAESLTEEYLINNKEISADLLKVAHHGSNSSTSKDFIDKVMPQYAIISVGSNNLYGHPTDEVIDRLKGVNATIYRTDYNGDIVCSSDRNTLSCDIEKNGEFKVLDNSQTQVKRSITKNVETTEYKYILNTNSHKFHYPECKSVDRMSEQNKEYSNASRDEIIAMGYDPCKNCNP